MERFSSNFSRISRTWFDPHVSVYDMAHTWTLSRDAFYGNPPSSHPDYVFIQLASSRCGGVRAEEFHRGVKKTKEEKREGERGKKKRPMDTSQNLRRNSISVCREKKQKRRSLKKKKRNDSRSTTICFVYARTRSPCATWCRWSKKCSRTRVLATNEHKGEREKKKI